MAVDGEDLPAVGLEAGGDVLGEGDFGGAFDGDLVGVVEGDQAAELEVAGEGGGFVADALHHVAVAAEYISIVVEPGLGGGVEAGGHHVPGEGHADGVGDALSEGAGGGFDAGGAAELGVAGGEGAELAEALEVVDRDGVAGEVEQGVEEGGAVAAGEDEAVAVGPEGGGGGGVEMLEPEDGGDVGHAHGHAGVA